MDMSFLGLNKVIGVYQGKIGCCCGCKGIHRANSQFKGSKILDDAMGEDTKVSNIVVKRVVSRVIEELKDLTDRQIEDLKLRQDLLISDSHLALDLTDEDKRLIVFFVD